MALSKINRTSLNTGIDDNSNATAITIDSSERILMPSQPAFRITDGDAQTLPTSAAHTVVDFNNTDFDNQSGFNTSNSRYTAQVSGRYYINSTVMFQSNLTTYTYVWMNFRVNGTSISAGEDMMPRPSGGSYSSLSKNEIVYLNANDYIDVTLGQLGGTGMAVRTGFRRFQGYLLG